MTRLWSRGHAARPRGVNATACAQSFLNRSGCVIALLCALVLAPRSGVAQELEPGAYWPLPVGLNILTAINNVNWGDVTFDPSLPVDHTSARINTTIGVYTRWLSIGGRSANVSAQLPLVAGHLEGTYLGTPAALGRFGPGDPRFRVGVNLYGAPSMAAKEFASYRLRTLVGASLTVAPPLGQYDEAQVINIGANRWSVRPELGLAHAAGPWVAELMAGAWLFSDNIAFRGTGTRSQDPIASAQLHVTYRFRRSVWLAADANFYVGGQTAIDGAKHVDRQRNSRVGATLSAAVTRRHSVRASVSLGALTTIGGDFTSVAVGYNYAWISPAQ